MAEEKKKAAAAASEYDPQAAATAALPTTPANDPQAEAEKILAAARAEAEAIIAGAKAKAESESDETDTKKKAASSGPKLVKVRLFKDNDKYKNDVFVAVNGRSFQIKRGEDVMVPDFVAEVLDRSREQDEATARLIERESAKYQQEARANGI